MRKSNNMHTQVLRLLVREILKEDIVPTSPTVNIGNVSQSFVGVTTPNLTAMLAAGAFASGYPYLNEYLASDCIIAQPLYPLMKTEAEYQKYNVGKAASGSAGAGSLLSGYITALNEETGYLYNDTSNIPQYELVLANMKNNPPPWPAGTEQWLSLDTRQRADTAYWLALMLKRTCASGVGATQPDQTEIDRIKDMLGDKIQTRSVYLKFVKDFVQSTHDTFTKVLKTHQDGFKTNLSDQDVKNANVAAAKALTGEAVKFKAALAAIK